MYNCTVVKTNGLAINGCVFGYIHSWWMYTKNMRRLLNRLNKTKGFIVAPIGTTQRCGARRMNQSQSQWSDGGPAGKNKRTDDVAENSDENSHRRRCLEEERILRTKCRRGKERNSYILCRNERGKQIVVKVKQNHFFLSLCSQLTVRCFLSFDFIYIA